MFRKTSADSQEAASLENTRQETAELNERLWAHTKELEAIGQLLQQEQEKTRDLEQEVSLQRKRADEAESKSTIPSGEFGRTQAALKAEDKVKRLWTQNCRQLAAHDATLASREAEIATLRARLHDLRSRERQRYKL